MDYVMYLCPECRKTFKVKGTNKKVKCTKCGAGLEDMGISAEAWGKLDTDAKDKFINDTFEFVEEDVVEEAETQEAPEEDVLKKAAMKKQGFFDAEPKVEQNQPVQAQLSDSVPMGNSVVNNVQPEELGLAATVENTVQETPGADNNTELLLKAIAMQGRSNKLKVDGFMCFSCILFPLVGWMLYAFNAANSPKGAKKCMILSIFGMIFYVVIGIVILDILIRNVGIEYRRNSAFNKILDVSVCQFCRIAYRLRRNGLHTAFIELM